MAHSASCPTVAFIGAAGSGELQHNPTYNGVGAEVDHMADVMRSDLGADSLSLDEIADRYPAAPTSDLYPSAGELLLSGGDLAALAIRWEVKARRYFASIDAGIRNAIDAVKVEIARCPQTQLVLAGYSRGAIVVHQAELQMASNAHVMAHIAGTLLLGDGDRSPKSTAKPFGSAPIKGEGVRVNLHMISKRDVPLPATTAEICNAHDLICDFKRSLLLHVKSAIAVHTGYSIKNRDHSIRGYSPLLAAAADWIASKIVAAHPPPPPPAAASPPPPPPPAPIPVTGPTLVYDGDTAASFSDGDTDFVEWEGATGQPVDVSATLPSEIGGYKCVVLLLNQSFLDSDAPQLVDYLQRGGTIVALGEHGESSGFENADVSINALASTLGAGISINIDSLDEGDNATFEIGSSSLTAGVTDLGYNWISSLSLTGPAQALVDSGDGAGVFVAAQSIGPGTFVVSGDSNPFSDNNDGFFFGEDNGTFVNDLCP
jgi:Cutinase